MANIQVLLKREQNPELLECAEDIVARIKAGEITGFVVSYELVDKSCRYTTVGMTDRFKLTGMLFQLIHKIQDE